MGSPSEEQAPTDALYPQQAVIVCAADGRRGEADALAQRLGLPVTVEPPQEAGRLALVLTAERLQVQLTGAAAPGAVYADFVTGATARRGREAARADEGLLRAAGARQGQTPEVIDTTAGLGRDAWLLAAVGCRVTLVERHPAVSALLADALERARADEEAAPIAAGIELIEAEAIAVPDAPAAAQVRGGPQGDAGVPGTGRRGWRQRRAAADRHRRGPSTGGGQAPARRCCTPRSRAERFD